MGMVQCCVGTTDVQSKDERDPLQMATERQETLRRTPSQFDYMNRIVNDASRRVAELKRQQTIVDDEIEM